jgi:predicted RND superfamily exporter protein
VEPGYNGFDGLQDHFAYSLIPPLVVVIGIPNCIYFLNKFHVSYNETGDKSKALVKMVDRMGIVTLFCNISAAIGFAVFFLTRSQVLKEFGAVAVLISWHCFLSLLFYSRCIKFSSSPKSRIQNTWTIQD